MLTKLTVLASRIIGFLSGRHDDRDFSVELQAHLLLLTEDNIRRGMPPDQARREARLRLGAETQLVESRREQRSLPYLETFFHDLRYGMRTFIKGRGFTSVAVITLALGIGANTMIFSVVNTVFLKPLSYPEPDRLVHLWRTQVLNPEERNIISQPNFEDWRRQSAVFEGMALFDSAGKGYNLAGDQDPERVRGLRVSANLFTVLGVQPRLGRGFLPEEEPLGKNRVVVLSHNLWQRRYGGDRGLVGRTIRIDGNNHTVVGIMPAGFRFEFFSIRNEPGFQPASTAAIGSVGRIRSEPARASSRASLSARLAPRWIPSDAVWPRNILKPMPAEPSP